MKYGKIYGKKPKSNQGPAIRAWQRGEAMFGTVLSVQAVTEKPGGWGAITRSRWLVVDGKGDSHTLTSIPNLTGLR